MEVYKCPEKECNKQYSKLISLSIHFRKFHKRTSKELYVSLYCGCEEPTCACGCGGKVRYLDSTRGFRKFIRGHVARIPSRNNFVSKKAQENSAKTRRKMFAKGELQIWNKGLTKESHPSVAQYGKSGSKTILSNSDEIKARSARMKKGRLDGTVPTLFGSEHPQWNGGTSSLTNICHAYSRFYKEWKRPKLEATRFSCSICGAKSGSKNKNGNRIKLEIHHTNERMSDIIYKAANKHKWERAVTTRTIVKNGEVLHKLKIKIAEEVANYHTRNNVPGIVVCLDCHNYKHKDEPSCQRSYP